MAAAAASAVLVDDFDDAIVVVVVTDRKPLLNHKLFYFCFQVLSSKVIRSNQ